MSIYFINISVFGIAELVRERESRSRVSVFSGGAINCRIASMIALISCHAYRRDLRGPQIFVPARDLSQASRRNFTNARMIAMFTFTARGLFKHTRQHGHALLGEGIGAMTATATTFCYSKLEYQRLGFRGRKLKHEI